MRTGTELRLSAPSAVRHDGAVEAHDNPTYPSRASHDENSARGATDDAPGDAAHEQTPNRSMTAPADHDDVCSETLGLVALRAQTTRTRVSAGHANCQAVLPAARA
jgi:hypothetical protein